MPTDPKTSAFDPNNSGNLGSFKSLMHLQESQLDMISFRNTQIDGNAVRELYEAVAAISSRSNVRVIVDFTGIGFISSGMMSVLLIVHKKLIGAGGRLFIVIPDENVFNSFKVANLHMILRLFPNIATAQEASRG